MATIVIRRPHRLSPSQVRDTAERVARRVEQRLNVSWRWEGDTIELLAARGPANGAKGRVTLGDADLAIEIHLPLALRPVRRFLEQALISKLDEMLGAA